MTLVELAIASISRTTPVFSCSARQIFNCASESHCGVFSIDAFAPTASFGRSNTEATNAETSAVFFPVIQSSFHRSFGHPVPRRSEKTRGTRKKLLPDGFFAWE